MITGGTGSFGNAVLNRFLRTDIAEIRIFSRDEKNKMICVTSIRRNIPMSHTKSNSTSATSAVLKVAAARCQAPTTFSTQPPSNKFLPENSSRWTHFNMS